MSVKADFHMHTSFSGDSDTPMEEMVRRAVSLGLEHICVTEHYDPDFIYGNGDEGMFELDTASYLNESLRLREKYRDKISVGFGVELGLQPHLKHWLEEYSQSYGFDFIIGSSHICHRRDPYYPSFFDGRGEDEAHHEYFLSILECMESLSCFDVYGHLDYVVRYGPTKNEKYTYAKHADVFDKILSSLIEGGRGIELNTKGFRAGLHEPNPYVDILKRYRALGGEIITVGSDAHNADDIAADFDRACDMLKSCGFEYYCVFRARAPKFVRL